MLYIPIKSLELVIKCAMDTRHPSDISTDLDAPTNLQMMSSTASSIRVSWDAPDTTNDCKLIQYLIWWDKLMDPEKLPQEPTQYTITDLTSDKNYTIFLVVSSNNSDTCNSQGISFASFIVCHV